MASIAELRHSSGATRCLECGKCSTLCPLSELGDFSVARMAAIHDRDSDLSHYALTVGRCLTCGSCEQRCPQGVRFTAFVRGLREELPLALRTPCPHGDTINAAARLSLSGEGHGRDLSWIGEGLRIAEQGEVALFAGCLPLFDAMFEEELGVRPTEIARAAIRLLNRAGIEPVVAADEHCCGHDLHWSGNDETFRRLAQANAAAFEGRGVKHIITVCAECTRTWRSDYGEVVPRYTPRVEHITEFLARTLGEPAAPQPGALQARVTFQDPCRLGRHLGVVDAPRTVIDRIGAELVEMPRHGADARCCGTSGFIECDRDSRKLQEQRLDEARATGAQRLLTACPKCWIHFACAQREDRIRGRTRPMMAIEDLTLFAARTIDNEVIS